MSKTTMKNINYTLFTFLWSSLREKNARQILFQDRQNGGLGMINLNLRFEANILGYIKEMGNKSEQPWSALYIYWFGFYLHFLYHNYVKNTYVHTLDIPSKFMYIVDIIKRYKSITEIWTISSKNVYSVLYLSKIQTDFKPVN